MSLKVDVQYVQKISLEMLIAQQMTEEGQHQTYYCILYLIFHSFAT